MRFFLFFSLLFKYRCETCYNFVPTKPTYIYFSLNSPNCDCQNTYVVIGAIADYFRYGLRLLSRKPSIIWIMSSRFSRWDQHCLCFSLKVHKSLNIGQEYKRQCFFNFLTKADKKKRFKYKNCGYHPTFSAHLSSF